MNWSLLFLLCSHSLQAALSAAPLPIPQHVLDMLSIQNGQRYSTCPFFFTSRSAYACFTQSSQKVSDIFSHTSNTSVFVNAREAFSQPFALHSTLLIVGDSLAINQFVSLACLLWEADSTITTRHIDVRSSHVMFVESPTFGIQLVGVYAPTLLNVQRSALLDLLYAPATVSLADWIVAGIQGKLFKSVKPATHIMFAVGHHFTNRMINSTCPITPNCPGSTDLEFFRRAVNKANELIVQELRRGKHNHPRIIWRGSAARHYDGGEWDSGGGCASRQPCVEHMKAKMNMPGSHYWLATQQSKIIAESARTFHFEYVDISRSSLARCDAHVGRLKIGFGTSDCVHYCVPGVPDEWNHDLLNKVAQKHH